MFQRIDEDDSGAIDEDELRTFLATCIIHNYASTVVAQTSALTLL